MVKWYTDNNGHRNYVILQSYPLDTTTATPDQVIGRGNDVVAVVINGIRYDDPKPTGSAG